MLAILADSGIKIVTMLIATPLIMLRNGCTWKDMGVVPSQAGKDIAIGVAAFCMLAPIVFAIQGLLTQIEPYKHPLIELVKDSPDVRLFGLLCFSAAIMAPLFEEWAFRVLLQGWLERFITYRDSFLHILLGGVAPAEPVVIDEANLPASENRSGASSEGITFLDNLPPQQPDIQWVDPTNPYAPSALAPSVVPATLVPEFVPPPLWKQWIPIFLSALLFALMHFSHGLAWIPLSVLALGLGYVYQRTHRILPSMVIHFCLNALSTAAVWVQMFEAPHLAK
jgi:membrane protease YdiL (CAAX protease family)